MGYIAGVAYPRMVSCLSLPLPFSTSFPPPQHCLNSMATLMWRSVPSVVMNISETLECALHKECTHTSQVDLVQPLCVCVIYNK